MKASKQEIEAFLSEYPSWSLTDNKLYQSFRFPEFAQAFAFMCEVAFVAEKQNHHPEWFNVYGRVDIELTTHEFDGISERDFLLAKNINRIAARRNQKITQPK